MDELIQIKRNKDKVLNTIPIKEIFAQTRLIPKPLWIRSKLYSDNTRMKEIKNLLRKKNIYSVCEEASCPNLHECFNKGTVTFMILGAICTRRCSFCNVKYGRPKIPDIHEPINLATVISELSLNYVVLTSVNRDDLKDGGANHFAQCITAIRNNNKVHIEILVPDFRNCTDYALNILTKIPPDIFNHNIENVPRLYKYIRPGANYNNSLKLLKKFSNLNPQIPTKSGLILGLGETNEEILSVMQDLIDNNVKMLTLGQYLQPSKYHLPVQRYVTPLEFNKLKEHALSLGFKNVYSGPFVRSSYHAEMQYLGY